MRLPYAVKEIFLQWLDDHVPTKKARVVDRVQEIRGGKLNVSEWGARLRVRASSPSSSATCFKSLRAALA
jgi:hypothetical protein